MYHNALFLHQQYFNTRKKYSYTILCAPLTLTEMFIFTNPSLLNNFLLISLICITHACMLYIHKYKAVIYSISTTLLFFTALLFVNLLFVRLFSILNISDFYGLPFGILYCMIAVSYTHLTLPTN